MKAVYTQIYTGPLTCLHNLILQLLLDFGNNLLNSCRVDTSVCYKLMKGKSCNLSSNRVKSREQYSLRCIIYYNLNPCGSLQCPNVPSFTPDNSSFNLVTLYIENSYGIFNCSFRGCPLYSVYHNTFSLLRCRESGLIHNVIDV